ncbi:histidine phosphatase family protein [Streptococcus sp. sy010]|uniref:histidine phosphatase family protein n=1 Tax=Streptococcus sp. sy010 TaxID=2600148 RepID=UPI0011B367EC|nr:histidine phosphatase family protein [Streptococcus sp. sy010]TWT14395.1 histidine phosphatase family protein [Streptococcus sp. sy010]
MNQTIYLVRHAQPDFTNKDDSRSLSQKGLQDCQLIDKFFYHHKIDLILSSPYKRAYETVLSLAKQKRLEIICDERFRERKITNHWIEDFDDFSQKQWQDFSYRYSDGESLAQVQKRILAGLTETLHHSNAKTIVIGSHGTAISTVIKHYHPRFDYQYFQDIKNLMPFILKIKFEDKLASSLILYNLFTGEEISYLIKNQEKT